MLNYQRVERIVLVLLPLNLGPGGDGGHGFAYGRKMGKHHGLPWLAMMHRHGWFIFQFMVISSIMVIYYHYSEDKNLWNIHITKTYFMVIYSTLPWSWMILKFAGELSLSRHSAALNKPWRWAKRPTQWLRSDAESGCLLVNEQFANWNIHTFYHFLAGKSW